VEAEGLGRCHANAPSSYAFKMQAFSESPMLKVDILVRRRPDLTHEQFVEHWRDVHAQLFSSQPAVKKYVRRISSRGPSTSCLTMPELPAWVPCMRLLKRNRTG
jgi:hypothetical protein